MMAATVDLERSTTTDLAVDRPKTLFGGLGTITMPDGIAFSPTPDSQRFLIAHIPDKSQPRTLSVVVNWLSELN